MTNITTKTKPQDKSKMCDIDDHILKIFEIKKRLGKGAYGIVWKAIDKRNEDTVAVKKIFDAFRDETDAQRTFREIIFLNAFRSHPNIVKLHNVFRAANNLDIYLVFEYMESDLHNIIKRGSVLKDVHKRYVMYQLINAIKYIHSGNVIHRDLKPSNILIDSRCRCKLADFGLARSVSNRDSNVEDLSSVQLLTDYVATRWYRAPEILVASKRYTKGIDMWSLGCILGEMLRGKPLFQGNSTINQIERIVCALPEITKNDIEAVGADFGSVLLNKQISRERKTSLEDILGDIPDDAMNLVKSLLVLDPLARLTAAQALEHPYITRFRHSTVETDLDMDIIPPFSDNVRLTVPQYRAKLYEIVEDVPIMRINRSATKPISNCKKIITYEKPSLLKTKISNSQHLQRIECRERLPTDVKSTSQERLSVKKNSPQIKPLYVKTKINALPSTKSANMKMEVLPKDDMYIDENQEIKPSRKLNEIKRLETESSTATVNRVDNGTGMEATQFGTQSSQESLHTTSTTATTENVRSLIKKRVSNTTKLSNLSHGQTLQTKPSQQQQQQQQRRQQQREQHTANKPQTLIQQQLQQHLQKQRQQFYKQQQIETNNQQKIQQQYQVEGQQTVQDRNRHIKTSQEQQKLNAYNQSEQIAQYQENSTQIKNHDTYGTPMRIYNNVQGSHLQGKSSEYSQQMQISAYDDHTQPSGPSHTKNSIKNIRKLINNASPHSDMCRIRSQNASLIHRETVIKKETKDSIRTRNKRTKSAENAINMQALPTIPKEHGEDVHCYEERLRRIEEEINCYKDEVKSYAYDNLRSSKHTLEREMATKSCDSKIDEPTKSRQTTKYKKNSNGHQLNNINQNNAKQSLYNKNVNKHFNYSPTSSSSRSSRKSDVPETRKNISFPSFPNVFTKNSFYQFMQRHKFKQVAKNNVAIVLAEVSTGGSGDHIGDYRNINKSLESSAIYEYQEHDNVHSSQQRSKFKQNVTNLIKAHLQPTHSTTTMQSTATSLLRTPIQYRKRTITKAF